MTTTSKADSEKKKRSVVVRNVASTIDEEAK